MGGKAIVLGGTPDGLKTALLLAKNGIETQLYTCISYGDRTIGPQKTLKITECTDMESIPDFSRECELAIDAMHPYAQGAPEKIRAACESAGIEYIKLEPKRRVPAGVTEVSTVAGAAALLDKTGEKALLTLSTKELAAFTKVSGFRQRLFARIPPGVEFLKKCASLGFAPEHLVCMKGPFTREMNAAIIHSLGVSCVVTKDSGYIAGLFAKLAAAAQTGTRLILIRTSATRDLETGFDEMCARVSEKFSIDLKLEPDESRITMDSKRYFPLFVSLDSKRVIVVGGSKFAYKMIKSLLNFNDNLCVISSKICEEIEELVRDNAVSWLQSDFSPEFLQGADLVIAATGDREQNHIVSEAARAMRLLVHVADSRKESSFLFPAVSQNSMLTAGAVALGNDCAAAERFVQALCDKLNSGRL